MIGRFFARRRERSAAGGFDPPAPERPLCVVGDIHGRADLLSRLLHRLEPERAASFGQLVFVGDYVDRGPHSRDVLLRLRELCLGAPGDVVCLGGNHERMMLDFIDDPVGAGVRWLRNGGVQTLASCSIDGIAELSPPAALVEAAARLADALGPDLLSWLRALPLHLESGNVHVVHAGADPAVRMSDQDPQTLIWGHAKFASVDRSDGQWVVHGHTIVTEPMVMRGRISVDTGAWYSERLTAARIAAGEVRFVST